MVKHHAPLRFKRIKSATDVPVESLPDSGNSKELYVTQDGTDIKFWDHRNQRFRSVKHDPNGRFLLSTEDTQGFFQFDETFDDSTVRNWIDEGKNLQVQGHSLSARLQKGLRAYYNLNDSSNITDPIGGYDGAVTGTALQSVSGKLDTAVQLSADTTLDVGRALDVRDQNFTLAFWYDQNLSSSSLSGTEQLIYTNDGGSRKISVEQTSSQVNVHIADNASNSFSLSTSNSTLFNGWTHIAVTRAANTFSLYVNQEEVDSKAVAGVGSVSGTTGIIGASDGSNGPVQRYLDEIGVWARDLSQEDIRSLCNAQPPGYYETISNAPTDTLRSYYTFDNYNKLASDKRGNHDGSVEGEIQRTSAQQDFGFALQIPSDGSSDRLNLNDAFHFGESSAFTVAFWMTLQSETGPSSVMGVGTPNTANAMRLLVTNDTDNNDSVVLKWQFWDNDGTLSEIQNTAAVNKRYFTVLKRTADGTASIGLQGDENTAQGTVTNHAITNGSSYVGASIGNADAINCTLDEIGVWDSDLATTVIRHIKLNSFRGTNDFVDQGVLTNSLRAYYSMDGDLRDSTGIYHGSNFEGSFMSGNQGQAAKFDSSSQGILTDKAFNTTSLDFTIALWIRLGAVDQTQSLITAHDSTSGWQLLVNGSNNLELKTFQSGSSTSATGTDPLALSQNTWYFVSVVRQNDAAQFYVFDNAGSKLHDSVASSSVQGGSFSSTSNTYIGSDGSNSGLQAGGRLQHVNFYERALTISHVQSLVNGGNGLVFSDYQTWDFLRQTRGLRLNAFSHVDGRYLEFLQDMASYSNYTVSLWVKPQQFFEGKNQPAYFVWVGDDDKLIGSVQGKNAFISYNSSTQTIAINGNHSSDHTVQKPLNLEQWYHMVLVRDFASQKVTLYIDGTPILTSHGINGEVSGAVLRLGGAFQDSSYDIHGTLDALYDQVTVFGNALTKRDIDILYNGGMGIDIDSDIKKIATQSDLPGDTGSQSERAPTRIQRYVHAYYSFNHTGDSHRRSPLDATQEWQRDDVGPHDATLVDSGNNPFTATTTSKKLGTQALQAPGDDSAEQQFLIGAADPTVDAQDNRQSFTIGFWFLTPSLSTSSTDMTIYQTDVNNSSSSLYLSQRDGAIRILHGSTVLATSSPFLLANTWQHIIWTFDINASEDHMKLYIGGKKDTTYSVPNMGSFSFTGGHGAIVDDTSTTVSFAVDELGLWTYSMPSKDVSYLYDTGQGTNDFVYTLWHAFPAQQDVNMKGHNVTNVRNPTASHHLANKGHIFAGDCTLAKLEHYYDFSGNARDKAGGQDLSLQNGASVSSQDGILGNCIEFSGNSQHAKAGQILQFGQYDSFSLSFWVRLTDLDNDQILLISNYAYPNTDMHQGNYYTVRFSSGSNRLEFNAATNLQITPDPYTATTTNNAVTSDTWHHVVVVRNKETSSETLRMYVDGLLEAEKSVAQDVKITTTDADLENPYVTGTTSASEISVSLLSHPDTPVRQSSNTPGRMAEFSTWRRVLQPEEVFYLYNDGVGINRFINNLWHNRPAHDHVDLNDYRLKNVGTPVKDTDAVRHKDIQTWFNGNTVVRQTAVDGLRDINHMASTLFKTADPNTLSTYGATNALGENVTSYVRFNDFTTGAEWVQDAHQKSWVAINNSNSDNTPFTSGLQGDDVAIEIQPGNSVQIGDRLELSNSEFTINVWVQLATTPSSSNVSILTDDGAHIDSVSNTSGFRLYYDYGADEYRIQLNDSSSGVQTLGVSAVPTEWNVLTFTRENRGSYAHFELFCNNEQSDGTNIGNSSGVITSVGASNGRIQADTGIKTRVNELGVWTKVLSDSDRHRLVRYPLTKDIYSLVDFENNQIVNQVGTNNPPTFASKDEPSFFFGDGKDGDAMATESTNEALVYYLDTESFPDQTHTFTFSAWFYVETNDTTRELIKSVSGPDTFLVQQVNGNIECIKQATNQTVSSSNNPIGSGGSWVHIVLRFRDSSQTSPLLECFVNAGTIGTVDKPDYGTKGSGAKIYVLPCDDTARVDLLGIWTRWMSDADITTLYNGGTGLTIGVMYDSNASSWPAFHNDLYSLVNFNQSTGFNSVGNPVKQNEEATYFFEIHNKAFNSVPSPIYERIADQDSPTFEANGLRGPALSMNNIGHGLEARLEFLVDRLEIPDETNDVTFTFWVYFASQSADIEIMQTAWYGSPTRLRRQGKYFQIISGSLNTRTTHFEVPVEDYLPPGGGWIQFGLQFDAYDTFDTFPDSAKTNIFINGTHAGSMEKWYHGRLGDGEGLHLLPKTDDYNFDLVDLPTIWTRHLFDWEMLMVYNFQKGLRYSHMAGDQGAPSVAPSYPMDFSLPGTTLTHQFSLGDGFEEGTQQNVGVKATGHLEWRLSNAPSMNTTYYAYIEYDDATKTLSTGMTSSPPYYAQKKPKNPPDNTFWYPISHYKRGEVYDASTSTWSSALRLYIGQVDTDANGHLGDPRTYVYQGRYVSPAAFEGQNRGMYMVVPHNIGTNLIRMYFLAQYNQSQDGYNQGDEIILSGSHNASYVTYNSYNGVDSILAVRKEGLSNFTRAQGDGSTPNPQWSELSLHLVAQRIF